MDWYEFTDTGHSMVVTVAWWVSFVSLAALVVGVFLFRGILIGAYPRVLSIFGFGGRGRRVMFVALFPAVVLLVLGAYGLWEWGAYRLQVDNQGISQRGFNWKTKQGSWDRLWSCRKWENALVLEFFRGDTIALTKDEFGLLQQKALFVMERVEPINIKQQQSRLLEDFRKNGG